MMCWATYLRDINLRFCNFPVRVEGERRNLYCEGMEIDARYVRRKDLNQYLPVSILGKKTRVSF